MKRVLFNVQAKDRHYIFFYDDINKKLQAYGYKKDTGGYFVDSGNEIWYLNKIIKELNKRYVRLKDVKYDGYLYSRYFNIYNKKSYFAKIDGDEQVALSYNDEKSLYDHYNFPYPVYKKRGKNKNKPKNKVKEKSHEESDDFNNSNPYENHSFGTSVAFSDFGYVPESRKKNDSNIAKKVLISVSRSSSSCWINCSEDGHILPKLIFLICIQLLKIH